MSKIFVGNVTSEGNRLIQLYLEKFMPDAVVEPLKASGIKAKLRVHGKKPDVALIIIDESLASQVKGVADNIIELPKTHIYVDDTGLISFLESKFGKLQITEKIVKEVTEKGKTDAPTTDMDFGYSSYSSYDSNTEIEKLKLELSQQELLVKSLTQQLRDSSRDSDSFELVEQIRKLNETLKQKDERIAELETESYTQLGKVSKAEDIIKQNEKLKTELRQEKEKSKGIEDKRSRLDAEVKDLNNKIVELTKISKLYEETKVKLADAEEMYKETYAEYESKCDEYDVLSKKHEELQGGSSSKISQLTETITDLNVKLEQQAKERSELESTLNLELSKIRTELSDVTQKLEESEKKVSELTSSLEGAKINYDILRSEKDEIVKQLDNANNKRTDLVKALEDVKEEKEKLQTELDMVDKEKIDLSNSLNSITEEKDTIQKELDAERKTVDGLKEDISQKNKELAEKEVELKRLQNELETHKGVSAKSIEETETEIQRLKHELEIKNTQVSDLEDRIRRLDSNATASNALEQRLSEKETELVKIKTDLANKMEEIIKIRDEYDKLDSTTAKRIADLQVEINDKVREIDKLKSDLELAKRDDDGSGKTADLRLEIMNLREENQRLSREKDSNNAEEVLALREEVKDLKEANEKLSKELLDNEEISNELYNSIFTRLGDCASPKLKVDVQLSVPSVPLQKTHVVCGGSAESNLNVYRALRNTGIVNSKKRILVIDLVPDSYIDAEFKVQSIKALLPWLYSTEPLTSFFNTTVFGNVRVASLALAYFNPLYLLNVNWESKLEEIRALEKEVDAIFINVGDVTNIVTKVLFQSFAPIMKSHIVVRATPINIRTTLLSLAGLPNTENTSIECMQYDVASKMMYNKLAKTYKSRILKDNEGLEV